LVYAEVYPNEKGATAFLLRAAALFQVQGIGKIECVISDNAFAYRESAAFKAAAASSARDGGSSNPTARGPTARSSVSTEPRQPNGPTPRHLPAIQNEPQHLTRG
jgi:hypothetical protein